MTENSTTDAGNLIVTYIKTHKISRAALSRKLGISYTGLYKTLKQTKLNTHQVEAFSHALKHDFFMDFSNLLPTNYHKNITTTNDLETKITALEEELKLVKAERDVLLKVLGK